MAQSRPIKMVVVGDGMVGKTCLLVAFTTGAFPGNDYEPTVFDNYAGSLLVDGVTANLTLWDTAGQEDYEKLRPLSYPGSDVFLLCFSISSEASYNNIYTKWQPEAQAPLSHDSIRLTTKADLRQEESAEDLVSRAAGKKLASKIKAYSYIECSAKTGERVKEVFEEAARAVLQPKSSKKKKEVHQVNKVLYKKVEDCWEPKSPEFDRLKIVREIPTIHILLSKDPVDATQLGYQAPGCNDGSWSTEQKPLKARKRQFPKRTTPRRQKTQQAAEQ
ncbi:hypothetical protein HPB50_011012 [Hyalomma asiaticum]|uniref:Uncharacterized protein n=1 Tax=Hyalomma asiaticum TaxID=266040 RepID=A0ACB7SVA5_HYAAI|nr:hypothetical protein HPB50_011012 [Hyalomma asiaticum]